MSEIKLCKNCKYFIQYYAKRIKQFKSVDFGHCINNHKRKDIMHRPEDAACKHWEQAESNDEKQQNSISELLQKIHKQLKELTEVLSAGD